MNTPTQSYDVIIVGLGPTGLTLANCLGQRGHKVLVLQRNFRSRPGRDRIHVADHRLRHHPQPQEPIRAAVRRHRHRGAIQRKCQITRGKRSSASQGYTVG